LKINSVFTAWFHFQKRSMPRAIARGSICSPQMRKSVLNEQKPKTRRSTVLAYQMCGRAHPLLRRGTPGTWSHHKPETNQTNDERRTKSDLSPTELRKSQRRSLLSQDLDLAVDGDPIVLPRRVECDIRLREELLGPLRHVARHRGSLSRAYLSGWSRFGWGWCVRINLARQVS
jgi:hypothetical protein